ncbi:hypothetical protein Q5P01_004498 [Channa striata]|uniref:Uncharacterized protein n=1 Tax=Channa striata TaxID=64152 RepID=A0AA88NHU7_CHASR|nr:hypothetical protein Q5P01_004498 [Channa striata]
MDVNMFIYSYDVINTTNVQSQFVFRKSEGSKRDKVKSRWRWMSGGVSVCLQRLWRRTEQQHNSPDPLLVLCQIQRDTQGPWWTGHWSCSPPILLVPLSVTAG